MKVTRRLFLAGSTAAAIFPAAGAEPGPLDAVLDDYVAPFVAARDFAGTIEIRRGGRILARRAYGTDNVRGAPNTFHSRFGIQSVSKLITEGTIYGLEDRHRLQLSDPLSRWLPDFPRAREVTLQMLLEHRAGLARDLGNYAAVRGQPRTLDQLIALVAADGYVAEPGHAAIYSNNGYRVLAAVIQRASGMPYHEACRRLVLVPLGLRETGPMFGPRPVPHLSRGMVVGFAPRSLQPSPPTDMSNEQGAASFCSTADDLARLAAHYPFRRPESAPGPARGRSHYGHDGFGDGYMAFAYRFPETETVIAMTGNIESGLLAPLQADVEAIAFGEPARPPIVPAEQPLPQAALSPYVGRYAIGAGRTMSLAIVDGRLAVDAGGGYTALWAIGPDRFFSRERYATLQFVHEGAAIARIDWTEGSQTFPCPRLAA